MNSTITTAVTARPARVIHIAILVFPESLYHMDVPVVPTDDGSWTFEADGLTPWAMGGPYETYRVDDLRGTISGDSIEFSLGFFNTKKQENYPTSYSGSLL